MHWKDYGAVFWWGAWHLREPYSKTVTPDSKTNNGLQMIICNPLNSLKNLAEWTGLEPATPGVTGRYSNQLNYHSW